MYRTYCPAYGAARAREILGKEPERIVAKCSGNIIKNVRCVIIQFRGLKGIPAGVILGAVAGDASLDMEVLSKVDDKAGHVAGNFWRQISVRWSFWIRRWSFTLSSKCMPVKIPSAWRLNTTIST